MLHAQQACKYLLPHLWCSLDAHFHVEPLCSGPDCCSGHLTGLQPILHTAARIIFWISKLNYSVLLLKILHWLLLARFFLEGQATLWNLRSMMTSHPRGERCTHCLKLTPILRLTYEYLSLQWISQLTLASSSLASYSLLFLSSCFGYIELFAVSLTLPAVSCLVPLLMPFPLPGMPSPVLATLTNSILSCTQLKHLFCGLPKHSRQTQAFTFLPLS